MYSTHKVQKSFPKEREICVINYSKILPNEARVITSDDLILETWSELKSKIPHGETSHLKNALSGGMYKSVRNVGFLIDGRRTPTLGFLKTFKKTVSMYGINLDMDKLLENVRIKFGDGGNAASAKLPAFLSPKLAYLVGSMRDGTLARSGKYEISISQKNGEWLKVLRDIINDIFQPSNKPVIRNNRVTLSNRPMFEYLHRIFEIPIGKKNHWGTPKIIKNAPLNLQKYYIRGFYDADGLSYKLGFCQVNKEAILFVKKILKKLGIKTGQLSSRKGKSHVLYSFNTSTKSHKHFFRVIGSLNPSKQVLFLPLNKTS